MALKRPSAEDATMTIEWLASDEGQATIEDLRGVDPLRASGRYPHLSPEALRAAVTQARHKPPDYPLRLVTAEGIQQATPQVVAQRRAARLARSTDAVVDAGCGIGLDAWAFQQAGLTVWAFEQDEWTAQIARANGIEVTVADVTQTRLPDTPVYVDPARRRAHRDTEGRAIRIHDPAQWMPPMEWVLTHASVARVAPGLREIPAQAEWHCSSVGRTLVDATLWFPPFDEVRRRASVWHEDQWYELTGPAEPARPAPVSQYVLDPDPAIVRTGLVTNCGGAVIDEHLAFVTFDERPAPWLGRCMRVLTEAPLKEVRAACRRLGMQRVTVWARGFDKPPDVGLREGRDGVVVLARIGPQRRAHAWVGEFT